MRSDGLASRCVVRYLRAREHPGKLRFVRWLSRRVLPAQGILASVEPGVRLMLHPRDWIEYLLLRDGRYEPLTLRFIETNLHSDEAALFAGVNFGLHVIVAARAVGAGGFVVGVEPQPSSVLRASQNIGLNGVTSTVRLVAAALGDRNSLARMAWAPSENTGAASLLDEASGRLTVPILRTTQVMELFVGNGCRLFLLDVQGFEVAVIRGLSGGLLPDLVVVEVDSAFLARAGTSPAELLSALQGYGYRCFDLHGVPVSHAGGQPPESNIVAVAPGAVAKWV